MKIIVILLICWFILIVSIRAEITEFGFSHQNLRAIAVPQPPFIFYDPAAPAGQQFSGYLVDFLSAVLTQAGVNNTMTLIPSPGGSFGDVVTVNGTSTVTGAVGEVFYGRGDVALASLTITPTRTSALRFGVPYFQTDRNLMVSAFPEASYSATLFLQPFTARLWVLFFCSIGIYGVAIWLFDRFSPFGYYAQFFDSEEHDKYQLTFRNSTENAYMSTFGGGSLPIRTVSGRIFQIGFYFFCVILCCSYLANLTANLSTPEITYPLNSIEQAVASGRPVGAQANSATASFLRAQFPAINLVTFPNYSTAVVGLRRGEVEAVITDTAVNTYTSNLPPCDFAVVGHVFGTGYYGLATRYNYSLAPAMDYVVDSIVHQGQLLPELSQRWFLTGGCTISRSIDGVSIPQLAGVFYMLIIFASGAFVILLIEKLLNSRQDWENVQLFLADREKLLGRMRS